MALTTNKKNKIIAAWKAGQFKSYYAVAKYYKTTQVTIKKILVNIEQSNTDTVELGVAYENAKKFSKNEVEIKAIENAVKERTIADEIEELVFNGTRTNVKKVIKVLKNGKKLEKINTGLGIQQFEEVGLGTGDYKNIQETFDKALITAGKAPRHANSTITNTNAQQNNQKTIKIEYS